MKITTIIMNKIQMKIIVFKCFDQRLSIKYKYTIKTKKYNKYFLNLLTVY